MKLLLADLEVEVVQEALELYVQMRPVPIDRRFEYRYRAAPDWVVTESSW